MVKSNSIPSGKPGAYQRWEMDSLDAPNSISKEQQSKSSNNSAQGTQHSKIEAQAEAEIAVIFEQARKEGYAAGYQEGSGAGYTEGRKTSEAAVKAEVVRIQSVLSKLDQDLQKMDQQVADDLLALSIVLAKKMITQALKIKPELIIPIVQEAIRSLPAAMHHPRLYLHPDDANIVHAHLDSQLAQDNWSIREDERLSKGGCRIEANGSEIDATLEVRWHRVLSAMGQKDDWIEKND